MQMVQMFLKLLYMLYNLCYVQVHFEQSQFEQHLADGKKLLCCNAIPTLFNVPNPPKTVTEHRRKRNFQQSSSATENSLHSEHSYIKKRKLSSAADSLPATVTSCNHMLNVSSDSSPADANAADDSNRCLQSQEVQKLRKKVKQLTQQLRSQRNTHNQLVVSLQRFLSEDQIRYLRLKPKSARTIRWSNQTVKKCLQLRYATGKKGYAHLRRQGFPVPAYRTLCQRVVSAEFRPGIQADVFDFLRVKMVTQPNSFKDCSVALDEMQLRPCIEYDKGIVILILLYWSCTKYLICICIWLRSIPNSKIHIQKKNEYFEYEYYMPTQPYF